MLETSSLRKITRNTDKSFAEILADKAPHFSSFDHIADPRIRRAKEIEQYLLFISDAAPELRNELQTVIARAHETATSGKRSVADRIIEAMTGSLPPATMEEFTEDLGLPYGTIYENLMKLANKGLVAITERPRSEGADGKRGGSRKPEIMFVLTSSI